MVLNKKMYVYGLRAELPINDLKFQNTVKHYKCIKTMMKINQTDIEFFSELLHEQTYTYFSLGVVKK